jgi:hypothetical protein
MNQDYFVIEWGETEKLLVMVLRTEEQLFEYLQNSKNKKISVYKGECILDWS